MMPVLILLVLAAGLALYLYLKGPKLPPETDAIIDEVMNNPLPELISGMTGLVSSDGLDIWYESISPEGQAKGTILLIISNGADALMWPPKFVRTFVEAGYQVIRYDHRGTGMSDWVKNWDRRQPYSIRDMAGDAVAILDTLQVQMAHVLGLSMGGMIAQEIAIQHPDRVASLTLMMTSGYLGDPDLPSLTSRYFLGSIAKGLPLLKYRLAGGERNLIKERVAKTVSFVGTEGLDIQEMAQLVLYDLRKRRGIHIGASFQHQAAVQTSGSRYEGLKTVKIPTLVIHGTADPIFPIEHGKKLVEILPNAKGLWLEGVGHGFPLPNMDAVQRTIISHFEQ